MVSPAMRIINLFKQVVFIFTCILGLFMSIWLIGIWPPDLLIRQENTVLSIKHKGRIILWVVQKYAGTDGEFLYTTKYRFLSSTGKIEEWILDIDDSKQSRYDYKIFYDRKNGELILLHNSIGITYDLNNKFSYSFRAGCEKYSDLNTTLIKKVAGYRDLYFPPEIECGDSYENMEIK